MKRMIQAALLAFLLVATTVTPLFAKSSDSSTTRLTRSQMEQMMRQVPIRNRLTTEPPPPQPYWKVYIAEDWSLVILCKHDDETGELLYCDFYF